ncbi:MAG: class I SAM-dependent methyltransferase [Deltaproteobacteria bacterium]|nr:class I SAM-dependent methyltransferase [Deltaproteobacteria bacterium]
MGSDRGHRAAAMRLGRFELWTLNNALRRFVQRRFELPIFQRLLEAHGIDLRGKVIVDAGCGSGYDAWLLSQVFAPSRLVAFDIMPEQIALARELDLDAEIDIGDVTAMREASGSCDAVFLFGVLHHIAAWRRALVEIARILKPGGVLLLEEPKVGFTWKEIEAGIRSAGLELLGCKRFLLGFFRSYLCQKPG